MKYVLWLIGIILLIGVWIVVYTYTPRPGSQQTGETESAVVFLTKMTETNMELVSVERQIPKTNQVEEMIKEAIGALLAGPTTDEKSQGLSVAFNPGTKVNAVTISGQTLTVDFNDKLDTPMGGSARVQSISQSLDRTIRQFPIGNITEIRFTVNGSRDAVLEP